MGVAGVEEAGAISAISTSGFVVRFIASSTSRVSHKSLLNLSMTSISRVLYLLIRTYQQLYAVIKSGKCVFFTCDYIDSYDGTSKKNCNKLSAIFVHLAKLVSRYVSDHTTFSYIGEIKTRSADLNFMEVGSLANILAKFTKRKIQIRDIGRFCLI